VICPHCGEENPDRFRFCGACGTPLEAVPASAGEERKIVSVLFADLVGFTERSDRADPEDVRAALRPYHALLKREIERFGGTVEKFIGDAVMAVFGAPVAHEDDPERAVRAALRITDAIAETNEERPEMELAVRVAVHTGEAVVALGARSAEGESVVAGDVVNTASRLQAVAPVGGVVVGERTYRSSRHAIHFEPLEPVRVKGKADAVAIWRAVEAWSQHALEIASAPTPFIGRGDELALLQQTFRRMLREPSVQLVMVAGEPGVGKSRLVGEFSTWVHDRPERVYWRRGRCPPYGEGITFWALGEIVKTHAGILESDALEEAGRKLSETVDILVRQGSEREWLRSRVAPLIGLPAPHADREESFTAWRTLLEAAASVRPLILVVEDLHWADDAMLEFLEHLADWSADVPILLLCTARPELYERRLGWGGGKRNSTSIALSTLTKDETTRLVGELLSEAVLPVETLATLLERSGGNPLYAEEFVRMLTDRAILERRGRVLHIADDAEIPVPENVQGLIAARLDTLPPDRKALLQDAAVMGRVFWSGAVAEMGRRNERAVRSDLHELARKELVRPVRSSSMEGQAEYSFWHILVRDVAYGQIPRAARSAKHRAAAEWIVGMAGGRVEDHAELLADHYGQALELARAARESADAKELETPTRRFLVMAGERAMPLDVEKAESYFRKALAFMPNQHADRPSVLARAAEAAFRGGRFLEAERDYEEAIADFETAGDLLGAGEAKVRLADMLQAHGETVPGENVLAEAVLTLERLPPSRGLASAYVMTARRKIFDGLDGEALAYSEKALAIAKDVSAREQVVRAGQYRGFSRCDLGDLGGLEDLQEALRLGVEWGLGLETAFAHLNLGDWLWQAEGPKSGLEVHRQGIAFAERRGLRQVTMWIQAETAWLLFELGEWNDVIRVADEVSTWERTHTGSQLRGIALPCKARVMLLRGQVQEATELASQFLPLAREIRDLQVLLPALSTAALIEQAKGDAPSAARLTEEWFEKALDGSNWLRGLNLPDGLAVLAAEGAPDLGRTLIETFNPRCAHEDHALLTARAIMAEIDGEAEEGGHLYDEAADRWAAFGNVVERGRCLLGAGRCLVRLERPDEAAVYLRGAEEVFAALRARPLMGQVEAWLERATALSS
jgi:class 3 adenylate cyclase/tetratricopeptide (TPR) repeat protein